MPTPTYDLIASNVLSSSASSVTFSSIPGTYRDLVLVATIQTVGPDFSLTRARFNSDTGANYNWVVMSGNGSTANSSSTSGETYLQLYFASTANVGDIQQMRLMLMDYSTTNKHKSGLVRADEANGGTDAFATRWASTSAINAVEIYAAGNNFASGSTFYLYGIVS